MTDLIRFLNVPKPWHDTASQRPLDAECDESVLHWGRPLSELFETVGDSPSALRKLALEAPKEGRVKLTARTISEIEVAIDDAQQPIHVLVTSNLHLDWNRTLRISNCRDIILDFGFIARPTEIGGRPVILISNCERVQIRGLLVNELHERSIIIENSSDIAVMGSAFNCFSAAAIEICNSRRVVIDRCSFSTCGGCAVEVTGDVENLGVLRSQFTVADELIGVAANPFIRLCGRHVAEGYSDSGYEVNDETARDMLTFRRPTQVILVENRFHSKNTIAVYAKGIVGLWVESSDFVDFSSQAIVCSGASVGVMIAGNRLRAGVSEKLAPSIFELSDTSLFSIFSNTIEAIDRTALSVFGRFGGGLIACNSIYYVGVNECPCDAIVIRSDGESCFISLTLILNIVRGRPRRGVKLTGLIPLLFLFDNHFFTPWEWSIDSNILQPRVSSLNNFSPVRSRNVKLSDAFIKVPRTVLAQTTLQEGSETTPGTTTNEDGVSFDPAA